MDRTKLIEAQRRNKRMRLCKKWNEKGIELSLNDFYDVNDTSLYNQNIVSLIHKFDESNRNYSSYAHECGLEVYKEKLQDELDVQENYVFFEAEAEDIGAIKISGDKILRNLDYLIENAISDRFCIIFICSADLKKGICVWKGEYDTKIYEW